MKFLLLLLTLVSGLAYGQRSQTIDADCLKIKDGTCIDKLELGYLDGVSSAIQTQLGGKVSTSGNETITGIKTFSGKTVASSTVNGFAPCPTMTETQRNAIAAPSSGDCVYNSTTTTLNVYNGSAWKSAGGGVNKWATTTSYQVDDVIIESSKFYICLIAHTSGTFATDLAAVRWLIISNNVADASGVLPLANGGTNKALTAANGSIFYTDTDSAELLAAGTSGQILQSNGAGAPSFVNKSISGKSENNTAVTAEEIQFPRNQLTQTGTNKHLAETGNNNLLVNPSFEHSTPGTGWTTTTDGPARSITGYLSSLSNGAPEFGLQHGQLNCDGTTGGAGTCTFYQDVPTKSLAQGLVYVRVLAEQTAIVKVYSRVNGVTDTTASRILTVDSSRSSPKFDGLYKIPVITGSTSTGIEIKITVGASEVPFVLVDDAFVGAVDLKTDTNIITPWTAYTPTYTGFGTVTNSEMQWRQVGQNVEIRGKFTSGTSTAVEARVSLPNSYTSSGSSVIPSIQVAGIAGINASGSTGVVLIEPSVTYLTFGIQTATGSGAFTKLLGSAFLGLGSQTGFSVSVPVAGLQGATSIYSASCGANCVDTFSALIGSTGTVFEETGGDWINGSSVVSDTSLYTTTINTGIFSVAPHCWSSNTVNTTGYQSEIASTTTTTSVINRVSQSTSKAAGGFYLFCKKQGADFVASRTIVGSFNEVMTTPGVSKPVFYSFSFAQGAINTPCTVTPCTVYNNHGNLVSSVTRSAAGSYVVNLNTGKIQAGYNCTFGNINWSSGNGFTPYMGSITASSFAISTINPAAATPDIAIAIQCHGLAP